MSDQPSATQKPKPGSLRDRIAAFEKSAGANTSVHTPPPPPLRKPAGFATWKPKQPSPPESPPPAATQTEHVQPSSSSMSASDARDSITKGASLKERMAALQNKGAFGAPPPPVGPKPAVERPKWKPPPVVQSDEADGGGEGIAAIEKSISPPLPPPLAVGYERDTGDSVQSGGDIPHGGTSEGANRDGDGETTQDPEEEERQRRAAIAARMARLGGARVGMAPPIIGRKPLVRKPTQEEPQQKTAEDAKSAEVPLHAERSTSPEEQKPSSNEPASVSSEPEIQKPGLAPSRRSSMITTAEGDTGHSPKIPASMPVPAVPRRTGPPRKKPSKPSAPPPELPKEEPATDVGVVEPIAGLVYEDLESTLESKDSPSTIEVEALAADLGEASALHDDSEELEKPEIVKSVEPASSPPLSAAHSPVLQQTGLPPVQTLEPSKVIDNLDEAVLEHSSPPPATPHAEPAVIIDPKHASDVTEPEEVKDDVGHNAPILERLGGIDPLTSRPDLSPDPISVPEEMHSEPCKSVREESLHEDHSEVVDHDYKLDPPIDQNLRTPPPTAPAKRSSTSSTEFDTPDTAQIPGHRHTSASLEQRPVPPPRRIVPAAPEAGDSDQELVEEPESDGEADENLARSHLRIPPPKEGRAVHPIQDEDEGDGSENDAPPLPVLHRQSMDMRASRSIPDSDSSSEPETDHDGPPLPVRPRPTTHVGPPPRSREPSQHEDEEPRIAEIRITTPILLDREVMDEDEGDPIDPDFHIPSRRGSHLNLASPSILPALAPQSPTPPTPGSRPQSTGQQIQCIPSPPAPTHPAEEMAIELDDNADDTRRRTIAERMARLGGIKFGTAPVPRPASSAVQGSELVDAGTTEDRPDEPGNEEEEERARKERISAKLASMGGMRIGMLPMGMSGITAKGTQIREEATPASPPNPVPPVRPSRLAPQPPPDAEPGTGSPITSDDGVQVEAEESEAEEVNYQDADPEEIPPIPSRSGRPTRRQSSGDTAVSPPPPVRRPPVPATPSRRISAQVLSPQAIPPLRKDSSHTPQHDYVMVDQIESQEGLPTRRTSVARSVPERSKTAESQEIMSSQWELPSIPTSTLDLDAGADLSLSWTDAAGETPPPQSAQSPSLRGKSRRQLSTDTSLSVDDLMALWGRVGVQVCEVATTIFEKSKKTLIGDGTYAGFVKAVLADVPNAAQTSVDAGEYGYLVYSQNGSVVQKRASEILPGDIIEVDDAKFKGHRGLQTYQRTVGGSGELLIGIVVEFDTKKSKMKVFQANQHVGQQTVELVSYRLEDLKSGTIKIYRVLEAA